MSARYDPEVTFRKTKVLDVVNGAERTGWPRVERVACVEGGRALGLGREGGEGRCRVTVAARQRGRRGRRERRGMRILEGSDGLQS